jgi:hypothetical protein
MAKFESGKTYATRSVCDHDTIIRVTVARRTAHTLTTSEGKTLRISVYNGVEQVKPWGSYSMAPIVGADDLEGDAEPQYADLPASIDPAKLRAVADCLVAGIIESLAKIHGCSVAQVEDGLRVGHPKLMAQAKALAERGATMALELAREGAISISRAR